MNMKTGRLSENFNLRLPDGMRDRIKDAAARNNRSMNAEIVATLEEAYPAPAVDARDALRKLRDMAAAFPEDPALVEVAAKADEFLADAQINLEGPKVQEMALLLITALERSTRLRIKELKALS